MTMTGSFQIFIASVYILISHSARLTAKNAFMFTSETARLSTTGSGSSSTVGSTRTEAGYSSWPVEKEAR